MFKSRLAALTITTALTSLTVFAQEGYTRFKSEASVQGLGSFVKQTTENGVDQGATDRSGRSWNISLLLQSSPGR